MQTYFLAVLFGVQMLSQETAKTVEKDVTLETYSVTGYSFTERKVSYFETVEDVTRYKLAVKTFIPANSIVPITQVIKYKEFGKETFYEGKWIVKESTYRPKYNSFAVCNGLEIYFNK